MFPGQTRRSHDDDPGDAAITTSCLLPLFQEDAVTVAIVRHSLNIIKKIVDLTNPG